MTESTYIDIQFKGNEFSPKKLKKLTGLPLEILVETGEKSKKGRYKGKPSPFGIAVLKIEPTQESILKWCNQLLLLKSNLKDSFVKEIIFDIESTNDNFSNFSITQELSNKLTKLNAIINFTKIPNIEVDEFLHRILIHLDQTSIDNKELVAYKLKTIEKLWAKEIMSSKFSYAIVIYLLESLDSKKKLEPDTLQKYFDEFQE